MPYTDDKGALVVANKIKLEIEKLQIPHEKSPVNKFVTVSQGICTQQTDFHIDVNSFIHNADTALYLAKKQGRNRIEIFT